MRTLYSLPAGVGDLRFVRFAQGIALVALLAMVSLLWSCSANPIAEAETLDQRVYATYGTFVIVQEEAARLVSEESDTVPESVQRRIIEANRAAEPIAEGLLDTFIEYQAVRAEFEAGATTAERVQGAIENVDDWLDRLYSATTDLRTALRGD